MMIEIGKQVQYWDSVADKKVFSHPIQFDILNEILKTDSKILDYGCGYGRVCNQFLEHSYENITGIDISSEMIKKGYSINPSMNLQHFDGEKIPFEDNTFDVCTLMAVLTCIPSNEIQEKIIKEIYRVLKPGGYLYLSDMYLQLDDRNIDRYIKYENKYNIYGVFELPDNGVVRHHNIEWINSLISKFTLIDSKLIETLTMNGNKTEIFQMFLQK